MGTKSGGSCRLQVQTRATSETQRGGRKSLTLNPERVSQASGQERADTARKRGNYADTGQEEAGWPVQSPLAAAALATAVAIDRASGLTTAPPTKTVGVASTPSALARSVTCDGQS